MASEHEDRVVWPTEVAVLYELQPRAELDEDWIEQIQEGLDNGREQDRILLAEITDPENGPSYKERYILVDGFHRWHALSRLRREMIRARIEPMTWNEALLRAGAENLRHGKPLDSDGKREYARRLWLYGKQSKSGIAKTVGVHASTVGRWAESWEEEGDERQHEDGETRGRPRKMARPGDLVPDVRAALARLGNLPYQLGTAQNILNAKDVILDDQITAAYDTQILAKDQFDRISNGIRGKRFDKGTLFAAIMIVEGDMREAAAKLEADRRRREEEREQHRREREHTLVETQNILKGLCVRYAGKKAPRKPGVPYKTQRLMELDHYEEQARTATVESLEQIARHMINEQVLQEAREKVLAEVMEERQKVAPAADLQMTFKPHRPAEVKKEIEARQAGRAEYTPKTEEERREESKTAIAIILRERLKLIREYLTEPMYFDGKRLTKADIYREITGQDHWSEYQEGMLGAVETMLVELEAAID